MDHAMHFQHSKSIRCSLLQLGELCNLRLNRDVRDHIQLFEWIRAWHSKVHYWLPFMWSSNTNQKQNFGEALHWTDGSTHFSRFRCTPRKPGWGSFSRKGRGGGRKLGSQIINSVAHAQWLLTYHFEGLFSPPFYSSKSMWIILYIFFPLVFVCKLPNV